MDATRLGQVSAMLMESLDNEDLKDAEIGEVMVLAEVRVAEDDDSEWTYIAWRCSDVREWVQRGILHAALDQERVTEEDEE